MSKNEKFQIKKVNGALVGSQQQVALANHQRLADTWLNIEMAVLGDGSGSMSAHDSYDMQERFTVLKFELAKLQARNPGKIAVFSFSNDCEWNPDGEPRYMGGSTNLAGALTHLRSLGIADLEIPLTIICDGEPDSEEMTLAEARKFTCKINTIFVGDPDNDRAIKFMKQLASMTGGSSENNFTMTQRLLSDSVERLMLTDGSKDKGPIQL